MSKAWAALKKKNKMVMKKKLEGGLKSNMTEFVVEVWFVVEFWGGQTDGVGNRKYLRPMLHMLNLSI